MLEKAMRLCEASFGMFWTFDGDSTFQATALRGVPAEFAEFRQRLEESGFYDPTPVWLELFSTDFYWVGIS